MSVAPTQESPTSSALNEADLSALRDDLNALKARTKRMEETARLKEAQRQAEREEASLKELKLRLRTVPRTELHRLESKAESNGEREMFREAAYFQMNLFEFAKHVLNARALWRICPTLVMAPEYPQALTQACLEESKFEDTSWKTT